MRLTLEDFKFCGAHIKVYTAEIPQIDNLEDFTMEQICEYVAEGLEEYLAWIPIHEEDYEE